MRKSGLWANARLVAALLICVFGVVQATAGELGEPKESWSDKWQDSADRPGGPADVFNAKRSARIVDYFAAVNQATLERLNAINEASAQLIQDLDNPDMKDKASDVFSEARKEADKVWTKEEKKAYDDLVNGIRNDYRTAVNDRANEFRKARLTIKRSFKLKATPCYCREASHRYDSVEGTIVHPRVEKGEEGLFEWEMADPRHDCNPDRQDISGEFRHKSIYPIIDDKDVGVSFYLEIRKELDGIKRTPFRVGALKCTFKLTERTCVAQARRDMGGITDEQLETCQILLDQAEFKRHTLENQQ